MEVRSDIDVFAHWPASSDLLDLLKRCRDQLDGFEAYIVGGLVRDALLGKESRDIDIVIVNDGAAAAQRLTDGLGGELLRHEQFGTATLTLPQGEALDIVQARRESYPFPGALPQVEFGTLADDLRRRDFRANSLAIGIDAQHWGLLVDAGGGYEDLCNGVVRIWHERSFLDDPTRIFRAIKYAVRCGWHLDELTHKALLESLATGALTTVSATRLHRELELILAEAKAPQILLALLREGVLQALNCPLGASIGDVIARLTDDQCAKWPHFDYFKAAQRSQLLLNILLSRATIDEGTSWLQKLSFPAEQTKLYARCRRVSDEWQRDVVKYSGGARYCRLPNDELQLASLYYDNYDDPKITELEWYHRCWMKVPALLNGQHLRTLGVPSGPNFGRILHKLRAAQIDGIVSNKNEAESWITRKMAEGHLDATAGC